MALFNCPECGKEISDQAVSCPHCGYPLKPDATLVTVKKRTPGRGFAITGLVLGIFGVVYSPVFPTLLLSGSLSKETIYQFLSPLASIAVVGILALVFGILARIQGHKATRGSAAIVMGSITIASCIASLLIALL